MEVWHVLFPRYVQCVHAFVARSAQLFDLTISGISREYRYCAMRPAPPVAATLAWLAAAMHRARRAPACARVPLRCTHTRAQVDIVITVPKVHKAHNSRWLAMAFVASHGQHFKRCWAAAGVKDTLRVYRPEDGRAAPDVNSPERLSQSSAALAHQDCHHGFGFACECEQPRTR